MMYILRQSEIVQTKVTDDLPQHTWNVGGKKPRQLDGNCFDDVCEVYADGPELESVRRRCTNIPDIPSSGCMVWKGPFAQFVYDSLVYEPSLILPTRPPQRPPRKTHPPTG